MATKAETVTRLKDLAYKQRCMLVNLSKNYSGNIHLGGDMSMTDVLIALYHYGMNIDPNDIKMPNRDRFVLSKGHGAVCMYITMCLAGFFDFDEIVNTYGQVGSAYGMHPCKVRLPGVECSSGSLGHGLPLAVGMALYAKQQKANYKTFCMMGDGETCEGSVWEAAMYAGSKKLNNLVAIIDRNGQMMTSYTDMGNGMHMNPYGEKWAAFNWHVIEIDGHDMSLIVETLDFINNYSGDKPIALICHTTKGKGVSYMERKLGWHSGCLNDAQAEEALKNLKDAYEGA